MNLTDKEFREAYKTKYAPANYDAADTLENKMIFALAELGKGSAEQVIDELEVGNWHSR